MFEVELKFALSSPANVIAELQRLGADFGPAIEQSDTYFAHPCRNFAETDEALRLRIVAGQVAITYKGPVVDRQTKTREEIELVLGPQEVVATPLQTILERLSFRQVREVRKQRRTASVSFRGTPLELAWDHVPPLGDFLECELVTVASGKEAARDLLLAFAATLDLPAPERRSYLELLLTADGGNRS